MAGMKKLNATGLIIDRVAKVLDNLNRDGTKVVWFGYSYVVYSIQKELISRGRRLNYVIDNNPSLWGDVVDGDLLVFPVEQIVKRYRYKAVFFIASRHATEMAGQLKLLGVDNSQIHTVYTQEESQAVYDELNNSAEREGYTKLSSRESQLALLEILKAFRDYCDANKLRYFLAGGTMIGAARHKGFIPWDDDIDVYMPDRDFVEFISTFPEGGRFEAMHWTNKSFTNIDKAGLVDTEILMHKDGFCEKKIGFCNISIFRITGYPSEKEYYNRKFATNSMLDRKWSEFQFHQAVNSEILYDILLDINELKFNCDFDDSPMIGKAHILNYKPMWCVPHSVFASSVKLEFEGELFSVPQGYDHYLKHRFGNYMEYPPIHEQVAIHGFTFFKKA